MDKVRQQKLEYFLTDLDGKIREIRDYLLLDKGALLLDAIDKFEEENAEFLQYNPAGQDELNKRKWIVQYILFPIIADDKVEELLQYHLLEALSVGLDLEELMKMRAITISELLWPKLSQQYLKALMQNTQLIGSDPISLDNEKTSFLPYVKNWISLYNRKYGIDKHEGLEPHQFILDNPNAQQLSKSLKENLLKVLKFYESLKVHSLSEIEAELRKMQLGFAAQQAAAFSVSKGKERVSLPKPQNTPPGKPLETPVATHNRHENEPIKSTLSQISVRDTSPQEIRPDTPTKPEESPKPIAKNHEPLSKEEIEALQEEITEDRKIKIMQGEYSTMNSRLHIIKEEPISKDTTKEIVNAHILELLEKFPALQTYKLTNNSISLPIAPFSLTPTIQNWIQYYSKECGKGKHSPQERESFLELLRSKQNISPADFQKLSKIYRSMDEKTPLPFDKNNNELLLDLVKVGEKLKTEPPEEDENTLQKPLQDIRVRDKISRKQEIKKDNGYLDLELVPANPLINKNDKQTK